MSQIIVVEIEDERRDRKTYAFAKGPIRIGRNALNEIVLDRSFVSQWHGALHISAEGVYYVDLGSTNGTTHFGRRLPKNTPTPLSVDERAQLVIGKIAIHVRPAREGERVEEGALAPNSSFDAPMVGRRATVMFGRPGEGAQAGTELLAVNQRAVLEDALSAVDRVRPSYDAYRTAWREVIAQMRARLERLPPSMRAPTLRHILRELPQIAREPELAELLKELGLTLDAVNVFDTEAWLARLVPESSSSTEASQVNVPIAMERVGATLETLAQSFVELRNGKAAFCEEIGLQAGAETELSRSDSGRGILAYLLDWDAEGLERLGELRRAFADIAMHQVAVIAGVAEGGRELLENVSPASNGALAPRSWLMRFVPTLRLSALRRRHTELLAEDGFTHVLFGRAFARAYWTVLGRE